MLHRSNKSVFASTTYNKQPTVEKAGQKTAKIPALQKLTQMTNDNHTHMVIDHMCRIVIVMKLDRESLDLK